MNMTQLKKLPENPFFAIATTLLTAATWFWDAWGPLRYILFVLSFYLLAWHIFRYCHRIGASTSHALGTWFQSRQALMARVFICITPACAGFLHTVFRPSSRSAVMGLAASAAILIWKVPQWQAVSAARRGSLAIGERMNLEIQGRKALGQTVGMVLVGLAVLYSAIVFEETAERKNTAAFYSAAVEHLSSPHEDIRMAGAYGLRDLAFKKPTLGPVVLDIFSGFLRSRSGWHKGKKELPATDALLVARLAAEVSRETKATRPLDLSRVDLRGADLSHAELPKVRLTASRLDRANLNYALLGRARLNYASLNHGRFYRTHLEFATFWKAKGDKPRFFSTFLNRASFRNARFTHGTFDKALLDDADLRNSSFLSCTFAKASLKRVRAQKVNFRGSDFSGADLTGADFTGADLTGCNFEGAQTDGLILKDATITETRGLNAHFKSTE